MKYHEEENQEQISLIDEVIMKKIKLKIMNEELSKTLKK